MHISKTIPKSPQHAPHVSKSNITRKKKKNQGNHLHFLSTLPNNPKNPVSLSLSLSSHIVLVLAPSTSLSPSHNLRSCSFLERVWQFPWLCSSSNSTQHHPISHSSPVHSDPRFEFPLIKMVRAIEQEPEIHRSRLFHHRGMRDATGHHARTMTVDHVNGDWSLHRTNDKVAKSRLSREDGKDRHPSGEFRD